jgi:hypothetical protein
VKVPDLEKPELFDSQEERESKRVLVIGPDLVNANVVANVAVGVASLDLVKGAVLANVFVGEKIAVFARIEDLEKDVDRRCVRDAEKEIVLVNGDTDCDR